MYSKLWTSILVTALGCGLLAAACGGDDDDGVTPGVDGGTVPGRDGGGSGSSGSSGSSGTSGGPGPDGGNPNSDAGACTFAGHVIGLITTQTTPSAQPTADLGDS